MSESPHPGRTPGLSFACFQGIGQSSASHFPKTLLSPTPSGAQKDPMKAAGEKTPLACHVQFRGGCSSTRPPPTPGSSGERLPHPPGPGSRERTEGRRSQVEQHGDGPRLHPYGRLRPQRRGLKGRAGPPAPHSPTRARGPGHTHAGRCAWASSSRGGRSGFKRGRDCARPNFVCGRGSELQSLNFVCGRGSELQEAGRGSRGKRGRGAERPREVRAAATTGAARSRRGEGSAGGRPAQPSREPRHHLAERGSRGRRRVVARLLALGACRSPAREAGARRLGTVTKGGKRRGV